MMIRPFTRALSAAIVVLALALLVASPVQAGPVKAPKLTAAKVGSNFLDAALSWLSGLLTDPTPAAPQRTEMTKAKPGTGTTWGGGIIVTPNTGSCIDPQGEPCVTYP